MKMISEQAAIANLREEANVSSEPLDNLAYIDNSISGFLVSIGYSELAGEYDNLSAKFFDDINKQLTGKPYEND